MMFEARRGGKRCKARRRGTYRPLLEMLEDRSMPSVSLLGPLVSGPGSQLMPSIAIDPVNPDHVVVAYMDTSLVNTGYAGIGVAVTNDAGEHWQQSSVPVPADYDQGAANPVVQFDGLGHVFVSFMAATYLGDKPHLTNPNSAERALGFQSNNGVFVARSNDGGASWNEPTAVASHVYAGADVLFDMQPVLAVDSFPELPNGDANPDFGSLYVTWVRVYPVGQLPGGFGLGGGATDIMVAVSHDGGATFTTQLQTLDGVDGVSAIKDPDLAFVDDAAPGRGYMVFPRIAVGPASTVYVSTYAGGDFTVYASTDGGATFRSPDRNDLTGLPFEHTQTQLINGVLPGPALFNDDFRTLPSRLIMADPLHPGRVYAAAENSPVDADFNPLDPSDILFAVSNDYGATWSSDFHVAGTTTNFNELSPADQENFLSILNDDNDGRFLATALVPPLTGEVIAGQAFPAMAIDAQGNITAIWYDTRRDPANHSLDVFGTVSTDGGETFSANFRLTGASFDPSTGAIDAGGGLTYLGDWIGVANGGNRIFAVWTDTSGGDQDIYFSRVALTPAPAALNDRFEPNDTPASATDLGEISAERLVPRLVAAAGDDDWYRLVTAAVGVEVRASAAAGGAALQLELWDGDQKLATSTAILVNGAVVGQQLAYRTHSGHAYSLHVKSTAASVAYSLTLSSITADLGTTVYAAPETTLESGEQAVYRIAAAASGSLEFEFAPGAGAVGQPTLTILSGDGQSVLVAGAPGDSHVRVAVQKGDVVLLRVADVAGDFTIQAINLDQLETSLNQDLFFAVGGKPASIVTADLNGDNVPDVVVTNARSDAVTVLLGNGDGTFRAPRTFVVGAGISSSAGDVYREAVVADFNADGVPDIAVPNLLSADVSILLGRGDGTFQPQRRFDAIIRADSLAAGDFNGDGRRDLVAFQAFGKPSMAAVLLGRGDGTFLPPTKLASPFTLQGFPVRVGDFNGDGQDDIAAFSPQDARVQIWLSNGDGSFATLAPAPTGELTREARVVDINGDGKLDLLTTGDNTGSVFVMLGNGDGTFQAPRGFGVLAPRSGDNIGLVGLSVVDFDGDGLPDVVATAVSRTAHDPTQLMLLPGIVDANGTWGFGDPISLATVNGAGKLAAADLNNDGATDVVVAVQGGIRVIAGAPAVIVPNTTAVNARDLGTAVHIVSATQAIVPGFADAYFKLTVPSEAVAGAGDQVLDFSALFEHTQGAGLGMEVLDSVGQFLGAGARFRVVAPQGAVLTIHVFGVADALGNSGYGAYTLDIDVLPQVVSVQAESLLPGVSGPMTSLVITLQGDRLDAASAEDPSNYVVTWLDGNQMIPIRAAGAAKAITYDPGANLDVATGRTFPTAVRQTVTLVFDQALPEGSYRVEFAPAIRTADFSGDEGSLLASAAGITGHTIVAASKGVVSEGRTVELAELVPSAAGPRDYTTFEQGTSFLTQMHNDLGAQLDALLTQLGDDPSISAELNRQILARCFPSWSAAGQSGSFLIIWLDPVSIDLADPGGNRAVFNLQTNTVSNALPRTYVEVGGNVEVLVLAAVSGTFTLNLADIQSTARGGAVVLTPDRVQSVALTDAMRDGQRTFQFDTGDAPASGGSSGGSPLTTVATLPSAGIPAPVSLVLQTALQQPVLETLLVTALTGLSADLSYVGEITPISTPVQFFGLAQDVASQLRQFVTDSIIDLGQGGVSWTAGSMDRARALVDAMLAGLGIAAADPMQLTGARLQEVLVGVSRDLGDMGNVLRNRLGAWIRTQIQGAVPPAANTPPAAPAAPVTPAAPAPPNNQPDEEISVEEAASLVQASVELPMAAFDAASEAPRLDGLAVAALFATGAFYGSMPAEGMARSKENSKEDRRRALWRRKPALA